MTSNGDYRERVRKRLGRHEPEPVLELAEALCYPSFHPETLLRVARGAEGSKLRLVTLTENLWYSQALNPTRFQESAAVPPDVAEEFWKSIRDLNPPTIKVEEVLACDGMTVRASYECGDIEAVFDFWCPNPTSQAGQFVNLIYDLAWRVLTERPSIERLEQLHGYLRFDLPARLVAGEITKLRLFGSLSVGGDAEMELTGLLDSIPDSTPLVVDMTNFEGMATLLFPIFVKFAARQPIMAWAVTGRARQQIEEMGRGNPQIFETTEAASMWVRDRKGESC